MTNPPPRPLIRPLFSGPIDIVGDVHGEADALDELLNRMGYPKEGHHPEGRRLVYVGDLVDRGPNSPAVVERVMQQVASGVAQCVLGNHELNLLLSTPTNPNKKHGNHWFWGEEEKISSDGPLFESRGAASDQPERFLAFFRSLPLALERSDLRVVHACWKPHAVSLVREARSVLKLHRATDGKIRAEARDSGLKAESDRLKALWKSQLNDDQTQMHYLDPLATYQVKLQVENPVKVLSSGIEEILGADADPYHVGGKWRMTTRTPWWQTYRSPIPVIFGHYWRKPDRSLGEPDTPDLFPDLQHEPWLGPLRNCHCIDLSVGRRYRERATGGVPRPSIGTLAALRVPEWTLFMDDRSAVQLPPPGL